MNKSRLLGATYLLVSLLCISSQGYASYIYSYSGNSYETFTDLEPPSGSYTASNSITVSFELPSLLTGDGSPVYAYPGTFTISDGRSTLTEADVFSVRLNPDSNGDFTAWEIIAARGTLSGGQPGDQQIKIHTYNDPLFIISTGLVEDFSSINECTGTAISVRPCTSSQDLGMVQADPGTWTIQNTTLVPVPAALWLFGSGLVGLAGIARRKKVA